MNPSFGLPPWFQKVYKYLLIEVFFLLSLGASVRVLNAGLACPDWPLCFGDVIPDFHPQVYLEFLHRVLAGIVAMVTTFLVFIMCRRQNIPRALKVLGVLCVLLLAAQVILGGLTVLWQLHSKVVAAHLVMGTGLYAILLWIYLSLKDQPQQNPIDSRFRSLALSILLALSFQIFLGGLVASHYAALVCTDFPKCFGQWFPTFSGIIGLHVIHRTFAYFVVLICLINALVVWKNTKNLELRWAAKWLAGLVVAQFCIGVANVIFHTPPILAILHLTVASAMLGFAVYNLRCQIPRPNLEPVHKA